MFPYGGLGAGREGNMNVRCWFQDHETPAGLGAGLQYDIGTYRKGVGRKREACVS